VIGILGGVAGGKSLVARQLADLGAALLDADRTGHDVLRRPEIEAAALARWGRGVFDRDGRIDRVRLGQVVFAQQPAAAREREYLQQLTHPEIGRLLGEQAEQLAAEGYPVCVLDAPLLLEAGWDRFCDKLMLVDSPRELRMARALARGWSERDFSAREAAQKSLDSKRRLADVVVDNSGSPEQTRAQVERFWCCLIG